MLNNTLEFYERCKILGTFRGHIVIRSDCRYCDIITGNTHKKHLSHKGYIKRVRTYTCFTFLQCIDVFQKGIQGEIKDYVFSCNIYVYRYQRKWHNRTGIGICILIFYLCINYNNVISGKV